MTPEQERAARQLEAEATRGLVPGRTSRLSERDQRWLERLLLWVGRLVAGRKDARWKS